MPSECKGPEAEVKMYPLLKYNLETKLPNGVSGKLTLYRL